MKNIKKTYWLTLAGTIFFLIFMVFISSLSKENTTNSGTVNTFKHNHTVTSSTMGQIKEMRGVWVSYMDLDMQGSGYSCREFRDKFDKIVKTCKNLHMNTLIVHTRPFSDALYKSDIFPWSHIISKKQGDNPGYDPLEYMVKTAHNADIKIHAWVNPLRIQLSGHPEVLASNNPFFRWSNVKKNTTETFVVDFKTDKYYNPAYAEVRKLIIDGVKEIVLNYNVDGIHFDDYFYPKDREDFDSKSYKEYLNHSSTTEHLSLLDWRKSNINSLIAGVYSTIKNINPNVEFGISPACNVQNDLDMGADIYAWCKTPGYVDYICPQIYVNFENPVLPFDKSVNEWKNIVSCENIKLYYGLAAYKAGSELDNGTWKKCDDILKTQVEYARNNGCNGFMLFSYQDLVSPKNDNEIKNLIKMFD